MSYGSVPVSDLRYPLVAAIASGARTDPRARRSTVRWVDDELRPNQEVRATFTQCGGERFEIIHVASQDRF
jgi:hypothetical protein